MPKKSYRQATIEALQQEMRRDQTIIVAGVDIAGGQTSASKPSAEKKQDAGGMFGLTTDLYGEFGPARVIETPITESALIGMCAGASSTGLRPVAELGFVDFLGVCFDQIYNQAAKLRYMFGGKAQVPMVIRAGVGAGWNAAGHHSQMLHSLFTHIPGLKVVMPSGPYDGKGLLIEAIRDNDPVIFLEHKMLYDIEEDVPDEPYTIPFAEANFVTDGDDVTIIALSRMVHLAKSVADKLRKENIDIELVDPRTTSPLDEDSILESVAKTGRVVIVDEGHPRCGMASDIAALIATKVFHSLKAPIELVTAPHTPVPFSPILEQLYIPSEEKIETAVRKSLSSKSIPGN